MTDKIKAGGVWNVHVKDKKVFHVKKEGVDVEQIKAAFAFGKGSILKDRVRKPENEN